MLIPRSIATTDLGQGFAMADLQVGSLGAAPSGFEGVGFLLGFF